MIDLPALARERIPGSINALKQRLITLGKQVLKWPLMVSRRAEDRLQGPERIAALIGVAGGHGQAEFHPEHNVSVSGKIMEHEDPWATDHQAMLFRVPH